MTKYVLLIASLLVITGCDNKEAPAAKVEPTPKVEWVTMKTTDSMTDKVKISAGVINSSGYALTVFVSNNDLWTRFKLPNGTQTLSSQYLTYRIDKDVAVSLAKVKEAENTVNELFAAVGGLNALTGGTRTSFPKKRFIINKPKWVMWKGGDDFRKGKNVIIRYFLTSGDYKETTFPLTGSTKAIKAVLQQPAT